MSEEFVFHSSISEMEGEFRNLRRSILEAHEQEMERLKDEWAAKLEEGQEKAEETRSLVSETGADLDKIDKMEEADEEKLDEFLSRIRPQFVDRDPQLDIHLKDKAVRSAFYSRFGFSQANLIGADLIASDIESLEGTEGEIGNPSVWLYDSSKIKDLKAIDKGSGWGCWASGHMPYANKVIWWYSWVPPKNGLYWIVSLVRYNGFYILKANDKWYNCKKAEVHAYTDIDLHQYFWRGRKEERVIDKGDDNISAASILKGEKNWSFDVYLGGGDVVWFKVGFYLDVNSRGGGSYSELNFADGKANYIEAPWVFIIQKG